MLLLYIIILVLLLRLNSIVLWIIFDSEPDLFIDLLISYLFRIFLNEAHKCSHASGDMGSTFN
jgi:hypothetical protein